MKEQDFPEKVKSCLDSRFKSDSYYKPWCFAFFEVDREPALRSLNGKELKWNVWTSGILGCSWIEEDVTGRIWIFSGATGDPELELLEVHGLDPEPKWKIIEELRNKDNWSKYLDRYTDVVGGLMWANKVAKRVTEETGVEIAHFIPYSHSDVGKTHYYTYFDSTSMNEDQKIKEIEMKVDAIDRAYKLCYDSDAEEQFLVKQLGEKWKKWKRGWRKHLRRHFGIRVKRKNKAEGENRIDMPSSSEFTSGRSLTDTP
jgi:hypothetical protein